MEGCHRLMSEWRGVTAGSQTGVDKGRESDSSGLSDRVAAGQPAQEEVAFNWHEPLGQGAVPAGPGGAGAAQSVWGGRVLGQGARLRPSAPLCVLPGAEPSCSMRVTQDVGLLRQDCEWNCGFSCKVDILFFSHCSVCQCGNPVHAGIEKWV